MQLAADRHDAKDIKVEAAEDGKLTTTARKAESMARKQEPLISAAKAKASKVADKAEKLQLKLATVTSRVTAHLG
jgi:hypothetical protein